MPPAPSTPPYLLTIARSGFPSPLKVARAMEVMDSATLCVVAVKVRPRWPVTQRAYLGMLLPPGGRLCIEIDVGSRNRYRLCS